MVRLLHPRPRDRLQQGPACKREDVDTYEELADPKNKGKVCTRSGSHPYNLSLFGAVHRAPGRRRRPRPGCKGWSPTWRARPRAATPTRSRPWPAANAASRLTNTYYLARLMRSDKPEDQAVMEKVGVVFPEPAELGHARQYRRRRASPSTPRIATRRCKFLEYLASDAAQAYFANGNNEWPAVPGREARQSGARHDWANSRPKPFRCRWSA